MYKFVEGLKGSKKLDMIISYLLCNIFNYEVELIQVDEFIEKVKEETGINLDENNLWTK